MASGGEDGKVFVHGLYHTDDNFVIKHSEPVKRVSISPSFSSTGLGAANKSVVFGSREVTLCEKRFLGTKLTKLDPGDGRVNCLKWHGNLLAWGNKSGVKVMDMKEKQVCPRWTETSRFHQERVKLTKHCCSCFAFRSIRGYLLDNFGGSSAIFFSAMWLARYSVSFALVLYKYHETVYFWNVCIF